MLKDPVARPFANGVRFHIAMHIIVTECSKSMFIKCLFVDVLLIYIHNT